MECHGDEHAAGYQYRDRHRYGRGRNSSSVVRNIISTQTPITIDPVKTPTNISQQLITGTRELNSLVTVTCPSATVGSVEYPTETTWTAIVAGMSEGANIVSATAEDLEGRISNPVSAAVLLDTQMPGNNGEPVSRNVL